MPDRRDPEKCSLVHAQENAEIDFPNSLQLVLQRGCYGNNEKVLIH